MGELFRRRATIFAALFALAACAEPEPGGSGFTAGSSGFIAGAEGWRAEVQGGRVRVQGAGAATALALETVSLGAAAEPRLEARGELAIAREVGVERIRAARGGIEQSWSFARPPSSTDLEIRVAVSGARYAGSDRYGLRFGQGAERLRYTHATWIDAHHRRTAITARWSAGHIVLRVPAPLLAVSAYPAVLDPWAGPDQSVGDNDLHNQPDVAAGEPGEYLQAFYTDTCFDGCDQIDAQRIRAVTSSGALEVLDPTPLQISSSGSYQANVGVAYSAGIYLVVHEEYVFTPPNTFGRRIFAHQVDWSGNVGPELAVSPGDGDEHSAEVTAGPPGVWLVSWVDDEDPAQGLAIRARVLTAAGDLYPAADDVLLTDDGGSARAEDRPRAAWDGSRFVLVYEDERGALDVYGVEVTLDAASLDPLPGTPFAVSHDPTGAAQFNPAIACRSGMCLAAWVDQRNGVLEIFKNTITSSGAGALDERTAGVAGQDSFLDVAYSAAPALSDAAFLLVWSDSFEHHVQVLDASGLAPLTATATLASTDAGPPHIATSTSGQALVVYENTSFPPDVHTALFLALPNGSRCPDLLPPDGVPGLAVPAEACRSGVCSAGLCCNTDCSGACQTCTGLGSSAAAGTCGLITAASQTQCRAGSADGVCDPPELCDGAQVDCPADVVRPSSFVCRAALAAPSCDLAESCSGLPGEDCPADGYAEVGVVCRPGSGDVCDPAETCPGGQAACPNDQQAPNGSSCDGDTLVCNGQPSCNGGVCQDPGAPSCDDQDVCTLDSCAEPAGCAHSPIAGCCHSAADCDDGDPCTTDGCANDACTHTPVTGCGADAGVPADAAQPRPDAATAADAQPAVDAGEGGGDDGCACTEAAGAGSGASPWLAPALLGSTLLIRRRRR